jgi:ATP-binding cassette subfamily B protein
MGFFMDGLDAEAYDRQYGDGVLVRRILTYFDPTRRLMLVAALMVVCGSLTDTAVPLLLASGINVVTGSDAWGAAGLLADLILLAGAGSWLFNFVRQSCTARAVADVVLRLRRDAFDAVLARDLSFYDEFPSAKIVSRVTSDTEGFTNVVTLVLNLMSQLLLVVLIAGVMLSLNSMLALLAMVIAPAVIVIALLFRRIARTFSQQAQRILARVNNSVQEAVTGITVAKGFRQEQTLYQEFRAVNRQSYRVNLRTGFLFNGIFPILITVTNLGTTIVVYFGGEAVLHHTVSAGTWFLFVQSIGIFWLPLTSIASFWSQFQQGLAASERVFALIDAEPRVQQTAARIAPRLAGSIEFRAVDFRYTLQEPVLQDFTLAIAAGETIALVGHTGAGKSTLGKLVARFYEFQGGALLIDGQDIRTFDLTSYRRQIGVVPQTPFLFSGSVGDNIRYARPEAADAAVEAVARRIGGGDWLDVLPDGLQTQVGEGGRGLSMGQRQLIALARVLLQDPAIVILDEATASVDPLTEAQIQEGLDVVLAERTAIVIAHRLSTVRYADRILVLRRGRIVEEGNHEALLRRAGRYAQLYNTYFRHQSPDYMPGAGHVPVQIETAG